ncbi:FUSC family protein [Actinospica robiniae]|uniref:FUSC family protein n=1 Tax=Actinospica robiniae TaxID=304901 RepID=UPI00040C5C90|nr:FUSC family protein [Actinospica robiniae]
MSTYSETFHALRPTAKVVSVPRAQVDLRRGARLGMGVFVPLAAGVSLGHPEYGVFAALGALTAGFAATTGARAGQHAHAVLLSGLGMAVSGFAGAALAQKPWALLGVLVAATFAAGLCGVFSQRFGIACLQWPVALLLATTTPAQPVQRAVLLLAGGAWQALLTALDRRGESTETNRDSDGRRHGRGLGHRDGNGAGEVRSGEYKRRLRSIGTRLRAGLDPRFQHGQHVLRLTVVTALTHVIAVSLAVSHGYWAAVTALLVLKPGHTATIRRGLDRIGGTVFGVLFGVVLASVGALGNVPLLLVAAVTICLAYTVFTANYFVFCVFLTGFVVLLLDLLGQSASETAVSRLVATALGGTIALVASHIRPQARPNG